MNGHKCCEIQARKIWTNAIKDLHKSFQCQLTVLVLVAEDYGPVAEDYGEDLPLRNGVKLPMKFFALVGQNCSVGFGNGRAVWSLLESNIF